MFVTTGLDGGTYRGQPAFFCYDEPPDFLIGKLGKIGVKYSNPTLRVLPTSRVENRMNSSRETVNHELRSVRNSKGERIHARD